MKTIAQLKAESEALDIEAMAAVLVLKEADERAVLEAEIKAKQASIRRASFVPFWEKYSSVLAPAKRWRLARFPIGEGDAYGELFYRQATVAEIDNRPVDNEEALRAWIVDKVVWYPPAGDGPQTDKEIRAWIDSYLDLYPTIWPRLNSEMVEHCRVSAEIARGKV